MENNEQKDPAILAMIRELLAKRGAPISVDVNDMAKANTVEPSPQVPPTPMADGGVAEKKDPDSVPLYTGVQKEATKDLPPIAKAVNVALNKSTGFGMSEPNPSDPNNIAKGLFMQKRFAHGGVATPNDNEPKAPEGPSDEEKRECVDKALREKTLKLDDGATIPNADGSVDPTQLPPDAPQDSKLQAIMRAIGMAGGKLMDSPAAKIAGAVTDPINTISNAVQGAAPAVLGAEAPAMSKIASTMTGGAVPAVAQAPAPVSGSPLQKDTASSVVGTPQSKPPREPSVPPMATPPNPLDQWNKTDPSTIAPGLNPNDRQALAGQLQQNQHSFGNYLSEALAGLGDAVAAKGGVKQDSLGGILTLQTQQRAEALANFDKARDAAFQNHNAVLQANKDLVDHAAAADAYGTSPALAKALGAPPGTTNNDLKNIWIPLAGQRVQVANHEQDIRTQAAKAASDQYEAEQKNRPMLSINKSPDQQAREIANLTNDKLAQIHGQAKIQNASGSKYVTPEIAAQVIKQDPSYVRVF